MGGRESRQVRKEATVTGIDHVPWGRPAGAAVQAGLPRPRDRGPSGPHPGPAPSANILRRALAADPDRARRMMQGYTVIARRYRPQTFEEVVGQGHVARTLKNALLEGRLGHAYLFAGPRGVGKTSTARIFAKALNCRQGPTETPCQTCDICRSIADGSDTDVVEIDAASSRHIDDVQALREKVLYAPLRARFKIYILDEAHQMSKDAFNALLKTLEEPPAHVKFIFATTDPLKLPETIISRCQRFDFRRNAAADIRGVLRAVCDKEKVACPDEVLVEIAAAADGSMRDAESLLDQLLAYGAGKLSVDNVTQLLGTLPRARLAAFFRAVAARDARSALDVVQAVFDEGRDPEAVSDQAVAFLRDALLVGSCGPSAPGLDLPPESLPAAEAAAKAFPAETIMYFIQLLAEGRRRMKEGLPARLVLEVAALKMARWEDLAAIADLAAQLAGTAPAGAPARPAPPAAPRPAPSASVPAAVPPPPRVEARPAAPSRGEPRTAAAPAAAPAVEPDDEPEPTAAPAGAPPGLEAVWPRIVERVSAKRVAAYIREVRPLALEGSGLTLGFPHKFHLTQMQDPANRKLVEDAAAAILGSPITLHCRPLAGDAPAGDDPAPAAASAAPSTASRPSAEVAGDPGVKRVLQLFDGRVVAVEKA